MNCKHVNNLLSQYEAGELPTSVQAQVAAHLNGDARCKPCANCAARLEMLQYALPLLQSDAQKEAASPTPDLYAAFRQRLVTQPARAGRFPTLSGRLRWLPRFAVAAAGLTALVGGNYYRQHRYDAVLDQTVKALLQPTDNVHFTWTEDSVRTDGHVSGYVNENWLQHGYILAQSEYQNKPDTPLDAAALPVDERSFRYTLPTGVTYSWRQQPSNMRCVHLRWDHILPSHSYEDLAIDGTSDVRNCLLKLKDIGNTQAAGIHVTHEVSEGETLLKIQVDHYREAMPAEFSSANSTEPFWLTVWMDSHNRLKRYRTQRRFINRVRSISEFRYEYDQHIPATAYNGRLDTPVLPANTRIVVNDIRWRKNKAYEAYRTVHPVWSTMSDVDKQQVQEAAARWAQAWKAQDEKQIRAVVDVDWLLQNTPVEKRDGLNGEDVWRQIWLKRMAKEPGWRKFAPQVVFAYQADAYPLEQPIANRGAHLDTPCLPGLNAMCWIRARQTNGKSQMFPAHLYLVKRPEGWKVFEYCRFANSSFQMDDGQP